MLVFPTLAFFFFELPLSFKTKQLLKIQNQIVLKVDLTEILK